MLSHIEEKAPGARIEGFALEEMISRPTAQELIIGIAVDPTFGPVVVFGAGGTAVEVINDKSIGLPPLNLKLARRMIADTRVSKLLNGYRDRAAADLDAIAQCLVNVSQLVTDRPEIHELDINPLLADSNGIVALDVRIRFDVPPTESNLVIRPYPRSLEMTLTLPGGEAVFVRPVKPQDEGLLHEMFAQMAPADTRFRFFCAVTDVGHPLTARLTQIDYDRELALMAFPSNDRNSELWAAAHLYAEPDGARAEFALAVRTNQQRRGLGTRLLRHLINVAFQRDIGEIWGNVMADNTRMLALCTKLGFQIGAGSAGVVRVRIKSAAR